VEREREKSSLGMTLFSVRLRCRSICWSLECAQFVSKSSMNQWCLWDGEDDNYSSCLRVGQTITMQIQISQVWEYTAVQIERLHLSSLGKKGRQP
jgi:hypothetical protein